MTRKQIERVASEAALRMKFRSDIHPSQQGEALFIEGAEWRINSVWHDVSEKPKFKGKVEKEMFMLFCNSKKYGLMLISQDEWDDFVERGMFHKWAYVDDLLPERKEETK